MQTVLEFEAHFRAMLLAHSIVRVCCSAVCTQSHLMPDCPRRLMRAFRVLRIFGRLKSIRSIINALTGEHVLHAS